MEQELLILPEDTSSSRFLVGFVLLDSILFKHSERLLLVYIGIKCYAPLVVSTSRSFLHSLPITRFVTRLTRRAPLVEHQNSPPDFSGVRVTRSLVLFVCHVDRCLSFFLWLLCGLSFHLRILISPSVSSNSSCGYQVPYISIKCSLDQHYVNNGKITITHTF